MAFKKEITLVLTNYNLEQCRRALVKACIADANEQGGLKMNEIGDELGVSASFVSKAIKHYNIEYIKPKTKEELKEEEEFKAALLTLSKRGIDISKLEKKKDSDIPPVSDKHF